MQVKLQNLSAVIIEIFGEMFFLFPERPETAAPLDGLWHQVAVDLTGPDSCRLSFLIAEATALSMAENYLGVDSDSINRGMISDVLKESVNVMVGNLLNRRNDTTVLGIPAYLGLIEHLDETPSAEHLDLLVDGDLLRVMLTCRRQCENPV